MHGPQGTFFPSAKKGVLRKEPTFAKSRHLNSLDECCECINNIERYVLQILKIQETDINS